MASRHFSVKHGKVGRGKKHAHYIGGQGNFADKDDVVFLLDVNMPSWARDGADFFEAADRMERANGRTYTEFEFAIPRQITNPHVYAQAFANKILGKHHPYRLAVHDKLASDGGRNIHAHLMFTERKLDVIARDVDHFFLRANPKSPEKGGTAKDRKWNAKNMVEIMRQEYSLFAKSHGVELDLRSNLAQGLTEPEPKIGPIHDRVNQNINRDSLVSKVESLRSVRSTAVTLNPIENKLKHEAQLKAQTQRKYLWSEFQKQRKATYNKLVHEFKASHVHEKERRTLIKSSYLEKREILKKDHNLKYVERRTAISVINMERIAQELILKSEFESLRSTIKSEQNEHYSEKYRIYLTSQADAGDEIAQAELIRLKPVKTKESEDQNSIVAIGSVRKLDPALMNFKYEVNSSGIVTYKMHGLDVIKDVGKRLDLLQTDDLTIEASLRLAQSKFGNKLNLTGTQVFQERVARVAAEQGLKVEFVDPYINSVMQTQKEMISMRRYLKETEVNLIAAGAKLKGIEPIDHDSKISIRNNVTNLLDAKYDSEAQHDELKNSLSEITKIAINKGYELVKPTNLNYRGSIVEITSRHALQSIGKRKVVLHELSIDSLKKFEIGKILEIDYKSSIPKVKELGNDRQNTRAR